MVNTLKFILVTLFFTTQLSAYDEIPELPSLETIKSHESCMATIEGCREHLKFTTADFPMYVSRGSKKIETVVIVLHGTARNANEYLKDFIANLDGNVLDATAVIAPHFMQENDVFSPEELSWKTGWTNSWKYGFKSGAPMEISSYEVMDRIIKNIDESWNPKKIMVIGHSAGGQFIQRYAHGSRITYDIDSALSFVVSNPSSYLYSTDKRYIGNTWAIPKDCADYNTYIYGLENRNEYLSQQSRQSLRKNYASKKVFYLMGAEDTLDEDLDMSCEANLQGPNRIRRAITYFSFLNNFFPGHNHTFIAVPKVGHDHLKMFSSKEFIKLLVDQSRLGSDSLTINRIGTANIDSTPESLYFLNGGGDNIDGAFVEYLKALDGGDMLILSGKDEPLEYNEYFTDLAEQLNIPLNSVTTVLIHSRQGAGDKRLLKLINESEGIFFSGGDQFKYVDRLTNTSSLKAINEKVTTGIPFGGTSAGLAIMGDLIFSAENGSVSSDEIITDPMSEKITLEDSMFKLPLLNNILTDTHFVMRDRMGRLISFLGRGHNQAKTLVNGLGVDEDTALLIDKSGTAKVWGTGNVYLLRPTTQPQITEGNFAWKKIQVNRWTPGNSFTWAKTSPPDYFYDLSNGEIISSQADGEIY